MTPRIRIRMLAILGLATATLLNVSLSAQNRGGGGGGGGRGGQQQDPTQIYINQLKLEGKDRGAFRKAFNKHQQNVQKWRTNLQKWQKKNQKLVGKDVAPDVLQKLRAEKAEFDAQLKAHNDAYKESLAAFLSPEQVNQVDQIAKRVAEQRARRRANQQNRQGGGGGGGNRNR